MSQDFDDESSGKKSGKKTIGFSLKDKDGKVFNELNVRVENSAYNTNNDDLHNNIKDTEEEYDDADFIVNEDEVTNLNLKLDDNLSMTGEEFYQNEMLDADKLHVSINQYKVKFLGSVG